jgi:hypothetical protein
MVLAAEDGSGSNAPPEGSLSLEQFRAGAAELVSSDQVRLIAPHSSMVFCIDVL